MVSVEIDKGCHISKANSVLFSYDFMQKLYVIIITVQLTYNLVT